MIDPRKIREVQKYIEGRLLVMEEMSIATKVAANSGLDASEELESVKRKLVQIQAEPSEEMIGVSHLRNLVTRYSSIYDKGEPHHKADAFESLYRTLKQLAETA